MCIASYTTSPLVLVLKVVAVCKAALHQLDDRCESTAFKLTDWPQRTSAETRQHKLHPSLDIRALVTHCAESHRFQAKV